MPQIRSLLARLLTFTIFAVSVYLAAQLLCLSYNKQAIDTLSSEYNDFLHQQSDKPPIVHIHRVAATMSKPTYRPMDTIEFVVWSAVPMGGVAEGVEVVVFLVDGMGKAVWSNRSALLTHGNRRLLQSPLDLPNYNFTTLQRYVRNQMWVAPETMGTSRIIRHPFSFTPRDGLVGGDYRLKVFVVKDTMAVQPGGTPQLTQVFEVRERRAKKLRTRVEAEFHDSDSIVASVTCVTAAGKPCSDAIVTFGVKCDGESCATAAARLDGEGRLVQYRIPISSEGEGNSQNVKVSATVDDHGVVETEIVSVSDSQANAAETKAIPNKQTKPDQLDVKIGWGGARQRFPGEVHMPPFTPYHAEVLVPQVSATWTGVKPGEVVESVTGEILCEKYGVEDRIEIGKLMFNRVGFGTISNLNTSAFDRADIGREHPCVASLQVFFRSGASAHLSVDAPPLRSRFDRTVGTCNQVVVQQLYVDGDEDSSRGVKVEIPRGSAGDLYKIDLLKLQPPSYEVDTVIAQTTVFAETDKAVVATLLPDPAALFSGLMRVVVQQTWCASFSNFGIFAKPFHPTELTVEVTPNITVAAPSGAVGVSVQVRDAHSGQPVPHANVVLAAIDTTTLASVEASLKQKPVRDQLGSTLQNELIVANRATMQRIRRVLLGAELTYWNGEYTRKWWRPLDGLLPSPPLLVSSTAAVAQSVNGPLLNARIERLRTVASLLNEYSFRAITTGFLSAVLLGVVMSCPLRIIVLLAISCALSLIVLCNGNSSTASRRWGNASGDSADNEQGQTMSSSRTVTEAIQTLSATMTITAPLQKQDSVVMPVIRKRVNFNDVVAWEPLLTTDEHGRCFVSFRTSDSLSEFTITAEAVAGRSEDIGAIRQDPMTQFGFGEGHATISNEIPVSIEAKVPPFLNAGDRLTIVAVASNHRSSAHNAIVRVSLSAPEIIGVVTPQVTVASNGEIDLNVVVSGFVNRTMTVTLTIGVELPDGSGGDAVDHDVTIHPTGYPHSTTASLTFANEYEMRRGELLLDPAPIPGSVSLTATLPSSATAHELALNAARGLIREPWGCFEQTSSVVLPMVMAVQLVKKDSPSSISQEVAAQLEHAKTYVKNGYARMAGYESEGGGFEWFGGSPAHEELTAWGLLVFEELEASNLVEVDNEMVARAERWLMSRWDAEMSSFSRSSYALHHYGTATSEVTNAYVLWALAERHGDGSNVIPLQLDTIASALLCESDVHKMTGMESDTSTYTMGLLANAALLLGRRQAAMALLDRLEAAMDESGRVESVGSSITSSKGITFTVETTALVSLAMTRGSRKAAGVRAVRWLLSNIDVGGNFYSTQATVLALKAILPLISFGSPGESSASSPGQMSIRVWPHGEPAASVSHTAVLDSQFNATLLSPQHLNMGRSTAINIEMVGTDLPLQSSLLGEMQATISADYQVTVPPSAKDAPFNLSVALGGASHEPLREGDTAYVDIVVRNTATTARYSGMVTAVVGVPAGLELHMPSLREAIRAGDLAHFELERGGKLVLYWRQVKSMVRVRVTATAALRGTYSGLASRVYPYYSAEARFFAPPLVVNVAGR